MPTRSGKAFSVEREPDLDARNTSQHPAAAQGASSERQSQSRSNAIAETSAMRRRYRVRPITQSIDAPPIPLLVHDEDGNASKQELTTKPAKPQRSSNSRELGHIDDQHVGHGESSSRRSSKRTRTDSGSDPHVQHKIPRPRNESTSEWHQQKMHDVIDLTEDVETAPDKGLITKDAQLEKIGSHRRTPGPAAVMFTLKEAKLALERIALGESCGFVPPYTLQTGQFIPYPVTQSYYLGSMGRYVDSSIKVLKRPLRRVGRPYAFDWGAFKGLAIDDVPCFYMQALLVSPRLEQLMSEYHGLREALDAFASATTDEVGPSSQWSSTRPHQTYVQENSASAPFGDTSAKRTTQTHDASQKPGAYVFDWGKFSGKSVHEVPKYFMNNLLASPKLQHLCDAHQGLREALEAFRSAEAQKSRPTLPTQTHTLPHRPSTPQYQAHLAINAQYSALTPYPNNVFGHRRPIGVRSGSNSTASSAPYTLTYGAHKGKRFDEVPPSVLRGLDKMINDPNNTTLNYIPDLKQAFKQQYPRGFAHFEASQPMQYRIDNYQLDFGLHKGKHIDDVPHQYACNLERTIDLLEKHEMLKYVLEDRNKRIDRSNSLLEQTLERMAVSAKRQGRLK